MQLGAEDELYFEDVSATEIADTYGTPTYVYEENTIRDNFRRVLNAFRKYYSDFHLFYALKACNNPAIGHILRQEGAGIDAASVNEILLAEHLGLGGEDVMFSGNYLSDADMQEGLNTGVIFNLDDIKLLPRVLQFGKPEILSFRVNPGYGQSNIGDYVTNAGPEAKFGVHPDQVYDAYRMAKEAGITRFGAHMMPGSCVTDPDYFAYVTELLMDLIGHAGKDLGIKFEFIDLGGGLGIPYSPDEKSLDIEETARKTSEVFKEKTDAYGLERPTLMMEPARYFVGEAGYVLGRVHAVKETYKRVIGTDIGMNVLARPSMYGAYHPVYVNRRENEARERLGLCGQICENTDFWIKDRLLPAGTNEGDLVAAGKAGAYGHVMTYQYNGRLRPAEVLVNGSNHHLIRQRESFDDLIRHTNIPSYLQD